MIQSGTIDNLNIAPEQTKQITIPFAQINTEPGVEYFLDLSFRLKNEESWAPKGFEIAWEQFKLPFEKAPAKVDLSQMASVELVNGEDQISITGENFSAQINKQTGFLDSWKYKNTELVAEPLMPDFWRAPTDNDRGNSMQNRTAVWRTAMQSWKPTGGCRSRRYRSIM